MENQDIILLDINMPKINGFEISARLIEIAPDSKKNYAEHGSNKSLHEKSFGRMRQRLRIEECRYFRTTWCHKECLSREQIFYKFHLRC